MKKPLILLAGIALATISSAQKGAPGQLLDTTMTGTPAAGTNLVPASVISQTEGIGTTTVVVDIAGTDSWDPAFDPDNIIITVPVPAGAEITGVGWDVTLATDGTSWLSEARMYFDGSDQDGIGLVLAPGIADAFGDVTPHFYSNPILDLTDNAIPNIPILGDGLLYIQFFESYDDFPDTAEGFWLAPSTLTIEYAGGGAAVPTVGEWGMIFLGVALLGGVVFVTMRKRKPVRA